MSDSQWVKIPGGNWLRFDPLTDDEMAEVVKRLDTDYLPADMAGRYTEAWLDVARLISTLAAIQSLVALQTEGAAPLAEGLDVERLTRILTAIHGDNVPFPRGVPTSPREYAEQIVAMDARLSRPSDERVPESEET